MGFLNHPEMQGSEAEVPWLRRCERCRRIAGLAWRFAVVGGLRLPRMRLRLPRADATTSALSAFEKGRWRTKGVGPWRHLDQFELAQSHSRRIDTTIKKRLAVGE